MNGPRLLSGPDLRAGAESLRDHARRLGPQPDSGPGLIDVLDRSGLAGRGGASFPVGTKWRSVAGRSGGRAVVLANGAEGEPLSGKDRLLMAVRPHLVLDGAFLAAGAVGAGEVVLLIGEAHAAAHAAMSRALAERPAWQRRVARLITSPPRYVAGEESAAVHLVEEGVATPTTVPPRPYERGIRGRPTLVQNVESLAHTALVARRGDGWYRSAGRNGGAGTVLVTVSGAVAAPGVLEVEAGTTIGEAVGAAGGLAAPARAVLLGGYFGSWLEADRAWGLPLDAGALRAHGLGLGCGVVHVLPGGACGVCQVARVLRYLADESAAQCGPCFFGLRAISGAWDRVAAGTSRPDDLERIRRWAHEVRGRGACRHPDGAAGMVQSALRVFAGELRRHRAHELEVAV